MLWKPLFSFIFAAATFSSSVTAHYNVPNALDSREDLAVRVLSELAIRRYGVDLEVLFSRADVHEFEVKVVPTTIPAPPHPFMRLSKSDISFGVWNTYVGGPFRSWNVFKSRVMLQKARDYYTAATAAGLPMLPWKADTAEIHFYGKEGSAGKEVLPVAQGGILVAELPSGQDFNNKNLGAFNDALLRSNFPKDKNSDAYKKLIIALEAAKAIGLKKFSARIDPKNPQQPIYFTEIAGDVGGKSNIADALLDKAKKWASS